jgi:adenylate cyclase
MSSMRVKAPLERNLRLAAGLVMFGFVACHFLSHATGLLGLRLLQLLGHDFILAPWRSPPGLLLLLAAFLTHVTLGLVGLYRRRHLRMPVLEAWQFGLGLSIPFLLAPHVADARLGPMLYGLEDSYLRVLYRFWVDDPLVNLTRQFTLLAIVWIHGCIGLHMWLRYRPLYRRRLWLFAAASAGLPMLAVLGVVNAGWNTILHAATLPAFVAAHGPPPTDSPHALAGAALASWALWLQGIYGFALTGVLMARAVREGRRRQLGTVRIAYRGGPTLTVPLGYSVLEASRSRGVPHMSLCGGRGRCSTCRVRVWRGPDRAPPPRPAEQATLLRVGAPEGVRLACQFRPTEDIGVLPLLRPGRPTLGLSFGIEEGSEIVAAALYIDLRDSTKLAAGRFPYDAVFLVNRFVEATTEAILANGGHVTSVAGDGIMSIFGLDGDARAGARSALASIVAIVDAVGHVNSEFREDLAEPLRFGVGVHAGPTIVGALGVADRSSLQFLGDTGNVAARLEALTKQRAVIAIVSSEALEVAGVSLGAGETEAFSIRGRGEISGVAVVDPRTLARALRPG